MYELTSLKWLFDLAIFSVFCCTYCSWTFWHVFLQTRNVGKLLSALFFFYNILVSCRRTGRLAQKLYRKKNQLFRWHWKQNNHYWKYNVENYCKIFYSIFFSVSLHDLVYFLLRTFRIFMFKEKLLFEICSFVSYCKTMNLCQRPNHMVGFQIHKMNNSRATLLCRNHRQDWKSSNGYSSIFQYLW